MMSMDAAVVRGWEAHFDRLVDEIGGCFKRRDLRRRASSYVRGLLGPVQRKNGWQLAEHIGDATPHGIQRLWQHFRQQRVDKIADTIPKDAWSRLKIADGAKAPRVYDWAAGQFGASTDHGLVRWLLIRRSIEDPNERAYYLCTALPENVCAKPLTEQRP